MTSIQKPTVAVATIKMQEDSVDGNELTLVEDEIGNLFLDISSGEELEIE